MPRTRKWKRLGIGFVIGVFATIGSGVGGIFLLAFLPTISHDHTISADQKIDIADIGCPSSMVEDLATGRCEASKQTMKVIFNSFHKHSGHRTSNPVPTNTRLRELAAKVGNDQALKFKTYRIAALLGDPESQYEVGGMLSSGNGVEKDDLEALRWLHEAAHNDHLKAQVRLAHMLSSGHYVKKDEQLARTWLKRANGIKDQAPRAESI